MSWEGVRMGVERRLPACLLCGTVVGGASLGICWCVSLEKRCRDGSLVGGGWMLGSIETWDEVAWFLEG